MATTKRRRFLARALTLPALDGTAKAHGDGNRRYRLVLALLAHGEDVTAHTASS